MNYENIMKYMKGVVYSSNMQQFDLYQQKQFENMLSNTKTVHARKAHTEIVRIRMIRFEKKVKYSISENNKLNAILEAIFFYFNQ